MDYPKITRFGWNPKRTAAALALAQGLSRERVAKDIGATRKTVYNWLRNADFAAEVDRLSLMVGIAAKAERMRMTMRVVRQKVKGKAVETDRDLLDWLKFAQSETNGIKLELTRLSTSGNEVHAQ